MKASHAGIGRVMLAVGLPLMLINILGPVTNLKTTPAALASSASYGAVPLSALTLHDNMRKLWEDHIMWTRLFIVSAVADLPDKDATTRRLLQNQVDIGNAIKPFYGNAAGDNLTALLKEHILGAAALLTAAKAGDNAGGQAASDLWYKNANEIAAFLNRANPEAWPLDVLESAMKTHLDQTLKEAVDHLKGNYEADVADYDVVHEHILMMADTLSAGIASQFPDKFATSSSAVAGMPRTGNAQNHDLDLLMWPAAVLGLALLSVGLWVVRRGPVRG